MNEILTDTQPLPYVPQHSSDDVAVRSLRPRYSAKAALDATIQLRQAVIIRTAELGQHRKDAS
jgi:hypothetical protein